jgi:hypothetical protein
MPNFKMNALDFNHSKKMRHPVIQILATTGFSAFVLASPQVASALTLTYTSNPAAATFVPNPSVIFNTRPLQLPNNGSALSTGAIPNTRNFIYQNLVGSYAPAGNWRPLGQSTGVLGEQRFDYYFDAATSSGTGGTSGSATVYNWSNNLNLDFGSFYLDGSCSFCGSTNAVALISKTLTGSANFTGEAPSSTSGNSISGNQNTLSSSVYNIMFGASGILGTLQYTAYTNVTNFPTPVTESGGIITITTADPIVPTSAVPAPLTFLGAGAAFGFSRRLRRRISVNASKIQGI